MIRFIIKKLLPVATIILSLPACDGAFNGIYDEPTADTGNDYGFISNSAGNNAGRIYIDATDYAEWHYVDLHNKSVTTTAADGDAPESWDFAIHRYDAKTNGGAVWESSATSFNQLPDIKALPAEAFTNDEWTTNRIATDMSQMMDGVVVYAEDYYNSCLSRWLNVDTSTMPPIYTLSAKVYVVRLSDGTYAALRLANFMNDAAIKGFMTIDYQYPIEL